MIRQHQFSTDGIVALDCLNCRLLYRGLSLRFAFTKWQLAFTFVQFLNRPIERAVLMEVANLNDSQGKVFDQRVKEIRNELEGSGLVIESIKSGVRVTHYRMTYRLEN